SRAPRRWGPERRQRRANRRGRSRSEEQLGWADPWHDVARVSETAEGKRRNLRPCRPPRRGSLTALPPHPRAGLALLHAHRDLGLVGFAHVAPPRRRTPPGVCPLPPPRGRLLLPAHPAAPDPHASRPAPASPRA